MKILFITENFPYPLDSGGRIRTFHIMKGLAQEHEISLITTIETDPQQRYLSELEQVCQAVYAVPSTPETPVQLGGKILKNMFSSLPIVVERHYLPHVAAEISKRFEHEAFDVVHFDHLDATIYHALVPNGMTTVLDEHNIVSNQVQTSAFAEPNLLKKFYMRLQIGKTRRYEAATCPEMTRCLVCSDADKRYLLDLAPAASVTTIPNGVDVEYFSDTSWQQDSPPPVPNHPHTVIFVGMLDYGPGGVGVRYFCEEILPLLQQRIPDIRFLAVGQNPPGYLHALSAQNPNIVLTGRVDDIRPYVHQASVFVVPLKSGSGTRLKILDAMAMKIPVVSTSIGAEGLDVQSGTHLLLADTPEDFSAAIINALQNKELREQIRHQGFQLVQQHYSWSRIWNDLLQAYRELEQRAL